MDGAGAAVGICLERAVGIGGHHVDTDGSHGNAGRQIHPGDGIAGGFGLDGNEAALYIDGRSVGESPAGSVGSGRGGVGGRAHQGRAEAAGGDAAQLGCGAVGPVFVQLAGNIHVVRPNGGALDKGSLVSLQLGGHHIGRDIDSGNVHSGRGDTRLGDDSTNGLDIHIAGSRDAATALDGGFREGSHAGRGHIGFYLGTAEIAAAAKGGSGFCGGPGEVGVGDQHAADLDIPAFGVDKRLEAAVGLGHDDRETHGHISHADIRLLNAGIGDAVGVGLHIQSLAACKDAGPGHGGLVHGIVSCVCDVAGNAVLGKLDADGCGISESGLCAFSLAVIEEGLNRDRRIVDGYPIKLSLVGGIQQSDCHIGRHIHIADCESRRVDDGFGKGRSVGLDGYRAGGDGSAAVNSGGDIRACVADRHVCVDTCHGALDASQTGGEMGGGIGGIAGLYAHAVRRKAVALVQTQICLENALRVGIAGHQSRGNRREVLIGDVCERIGAAGGEHLHTAGNLDFVLNQAGYRERVRGHTGNGAGASVGHCHICPHAFHSAAAGEKRRLCAVSASGIEQALGGESACGDFAALDGRLLGAAEHRHRGACRNGFAEANVHTGHRRLRGSLPHCLHQKCRFHSEKRGIIAKDAGNVGAAVVGNGNIQGAGGSANIVADRHRFDLRAVAAFFLASGNADAGSLHLHAGGVQDGAVLCAQACVAHADAHRDSTRVCAAENRLRLRIHLRIHIDGGCDDVLADNACHSVGVVKAQEHVRAYAHDAAIGAEDQGSSAAGYFIAYLDNRVFRVDLAGLAGCLVRIGSHADVGVDPGAHDRDRARNAYARDTARDTGKPCIGFRIGGAGYRELRQCAVDGNVLAHIGIGLNAALDDGHTRIDCRHAAGDRDGRSCGFGVGIGCDLNGLNAVDAAVPRDTGFHLAFMVNDRKEAVDRGHTAGARAGHAEDAGIVTVRSDAERGGLGHTSVQIGDGVVAKDNHAAGHGHSRHTAGAHNRDGTDGAGAEILLIAAIIVLYKTGDCVVPLLLAAVSALVTLHGAGVCMDLNHAIRAERSVLVHAGDDIAVHHVHSQRRTNARDTAGEGGRDHVGGNQLTGEYIDIAPRRDADATADHRADRALGIILGCGNGRGFAQILVIRFVYFKVFPTVGVVGGNLFVGIEVLADVSAFGIEIAVLVAKLDVGLLHAVAFQLDRQAVHPVALCVAAGEGSADKAIRVKAALDLLSVFFLFVFTQGIILFLREAVSAHEQSVGGILGQLAAGNVHHNGSADARPGAGCRGARIAEHIPFRIGQNVHGAADIDTILSGVAADHTGGNGVVQHADNCRHAHGCCAAERAGDCGCQDLGIIQCGDIQLLRGDGHVLLRLGTGDLIGDKDIHRSGDRCRAADADARRVGSDEFLGIRCQGYIAVCLNHRAFAKLRHGAAGKPGNRCHRGDTRAAAGGKGCCHIEQIGAVLRGHIHIPGSSHAAAKGGKKIIFKGQGACSHAHARGAAAREAERQLIHLVGRLRRRPDAAACAQLSAAHAGFHGLIIDHGHNRGAYARAAADGNAACKVI